jgi:hypothetical protein
MNPSDEVLMAYADGEVDEATRKLVDTAMRDDPEVAARVARHRALRAAVSGAFSSVLEEPVPERLLAAAGQAQVPRRDNVVSLLHARAAKTPVRPPSWRPYALAASVLLGVGIGYALWHDSASLLSAGANGGWVTRGALSRALSDQLAADHPAGSVAAIGLSYRAKSGEYCRTFSLTRDGSTGVACREGEAWQVKVLAAQPPVAGAQTEYRAAASTGSPVIRAAVEGDMQGEVLDQAAEIAARKAGWTVTPDR